MSSWRYSFELVSRELELARKKKEALDNLYAASRISESTYKYIERELTEAIIDLEAHLKSLVEKMTARAEELEKQIRSLEIFLANLEIHYAAGDIDEESYRNQNNAITLGLEATKRELESIKSSLAKVKLEEEEAPKPEVVEEKPAEEVEAPTEVTPEAPTETVAEAAPEAAPQPAPAPAPTPAPVEEAQKPPEQVISEEKPEEAGESVEAGETPSLVVPKEEKEETPTPPSEEATTGS